MCMGRQLNGPQISMREIYNFGNMEEDLSGQWFLFRKIRKTYFLTIVDHWSQNCYISIRADLIDIKQFWEILKDGRQPQW